MKHFKSNNPQGLQFRKARKTQLAEAVQINEPFSVETLEGTMTAKAGDYLMRGVKGELYPCDKDIFNNSYEFVK